MFARAPAATPTTLGVLRVHAVRVEPAMISAHPNCPQSTFRVRLDG
jgi:hypothetical protein